MVVVVGFIRPLRMVSSTSVLTVLDKIFTVEGSCSICFRDWKTLRPGYEPQSITLYRRHGPPGRVKQLRLTRRCLEVAAGQAIRVAGDEECLDHAERRLAVSGGVAGRCCRCCRRRRLDERPRSWTWNSSSSPCPAPHHLATLRTDARRVGVVFGGSRHPWILRMRNARHFAGRKTGSVRRGLRIVAFTRLQLRLHQPGNG